MATTEHTGLMTYKDENGNLYLLYPITTKDAVEGLDEIEALAKNAVPLDGSKAMTGALSVNGGNGKAIASVDSMGISHRPTPSDATNYSFLGVFGNSPLSEAVQLWRVTAGVEKHYNLLHTGNKPSGSYTGNGSAAARTIDTGGIGQAMLIRSDSYGNVIASAYSSKLGENPKNFTTLEVSYSNGKLYLATNHDAVNRSGVTYYYQVL